MLILVQRLVVLGIFGLGALLLLDADLAHYLNPALVEELLVTSGPIAPLLLILLMAVVVISPIPSFPVDVAAGAYFGPGLGTLYAATGATLGAVAAFLIARWLGRDLIERFMKGHISFCTACSDRLLTRLVLVARLIPLVSFKVVSYGAGLTKMSVGRFAAATFLGMLPLTFTYVSAGPLLISQGWPTVVLGGALIATFLTLPIFIERYNILGLRDVFRHEGMTSVTNDDRDR